MQKREFCSRGIFPELKAHFFQEGPPILEVGSEDNMCWRTTITDATGEMSVKVWDRACQQSWSCNASRLRKRWEDGHEHPDKQSDLLETLNTNLAGQVLCMCTAKIWTYGDKEVKHQVQVNVDALEVA